MPLISLTLFAAFTTLFRHYATCHIDIIVDVVSPPLSIDSYAITLLLRLFRHVAAAITAMPHYAMLMRHYFRRCRYYATLIFAIFSPYAMSH